MATAPGSWSNAPWFSWNINAFTQHTSTFCLWARRYAQRMLRGSTYGLKCPWWETKAGEVKTGGGWMKESLPPKSSQHSSWVRHTDRALDACSHHPIKHLLYTCPRAELFTHRVTFNLYIASKWPSYSHCTEDATKAQRGRWHLSLLLKDREVAKATEERGHWEEAKACTKAK